MSDARAPTAEAPPTVMVVGGDTALRAPYLVQLAAVGIDALGHDVVPPLEDEDGAGVVIVAGGGSTRRDGAGALLDAISATRRDRGEALLLACLPREDADALSAAFASGADDVLFTPPAEGELVARVRAARTHAALRATAAQSGRYGSTLLAAGALIRDGSDLEETLSDWMQSVCDAVALQRAVLVLCTDDDDGALLVGASDDAGLSRLPIDLDRYPEVKACLETRAAVVVEDARSSELLGAWAELAAVHGGEALVAIPLLDGGRAVGALLLRSRLPYPRLQAHAIEFLRTAASLLSLLLRASGALSSVREQTRRTSLARQESERKSRALDRYRDFLDSAAECMVIVDPDGTVLYLNRAAEQLTGFRRDGLEGRSIATLVDPSQREGLEARMRSATSGEVSNDWFDLTLQTTSGERLIVSASTSAALAEVGAAIVSFHDVTVPRRLEAELQTSNEFLARLIDSTVDGIVASDLRGRVILFNKGAARLTGWTAEDVIRKVPVWRMYPRGQAQLIMNALRSDSSGQRGRLEPSRMEIVARDGTRIPVSLSASLVYEGDREVAIVGVVSDLREQLRIEDSLADAQEKLILSERQAAIAELAGTTAHELNQPLTSVMGYSELLRRRMVPSDPHFRAVDTILHEAERMAEIVRKIGRITKYETKNYVGNTQIIDLEKSSHDG